MNIKLDQDEIIDFFLLYIKDEMDDIDDDKESSKILKRSGIKAGLNIFESKIDNRVMLKYNQFKSSFKDGIRILS